MAERRETVYVPEGKVGLVISRITQLGRDHGVWIQVDSSQFVVPDPTNGVHSKRVFHFSSLTSIPYSSAGEEMEIDKT